jgi:uncharacterized protein YggE
MTMKMDKSVQITLIIAVSVVLVALIGIGVFYSVSSSSSSKTLSVNGVSTIEVSPDLVSVYFNVETKGATSKEAKDRNVEIVNNLKDALIAKGFSENEIQTQSFNVYEDYKWVNNNRVSNGFIATHSIKVEFSTEDTDKISDVIDAGVDANATVSYINFELSPENQNKYKAQAMEAAAKDARVKAEAVAAGLGQSVGKLVSVSVDNFGYMPWNVYTRSAGAAMDSSVMKAEIASVSIVPSDQEISASVTAVFKIA